MPEILSLDTDFPSLLPMQRSPGAHASAAIHDICIQHGHYLDQADRDESRMLLGQALENSLADMYARDNPGEYIRLGELYRDGISITPDLFYIPLDADHEIKLTWMSASHGDDINSTKLWRFLCQVKTYCYVIGTRIGRLEVFFVNGDYKSGRVHRRLWTLRFSRKELIENWSLILKQTERMQARIEPEEPR